MGNQAVDSNRSPAARHDNFAFAQRRPAFQAPLCVLQSYCIPSSPLHAVIMSKAATAKVIMQTYRAAAQTCCQRADLGKGLLLDSLVSGLSARSLDCVSLSAESCGFSIARCLAEESAAVENCARLYVSGVTKHGEVCGGEPVEIQINTKRCRFFAAFFAGPVAGPKPEIHRRSRIGIHKLRRQPLHWQTLPTCWPPTLYFGRRRAATCQKTLPWIAKIISLQPCLTFDAITANIHC